MIHFLGFLLLFLLHIPLESSLLLEGRADRDLLLLFQGSHVGSIVWDFLWSGNILEIVDRLQHNWVLVHKVVLNEWLLLDHCWLILTLEFHLPILTWYLEFVIVLVGLKEIFLNELFLIVDDKVLELCFRTLTLHSFLFKILFTGRLLNNFVPSRVRAVGNVYGKAEEVVKRNDLLSFWELHWLLRLIVWGSW